MVCNGNGDGIDRVVSGLRTKGVEAYLNITILFDCLDFFASLGAHLGKSVRVKKNAKLFSLAQVLSLKPKSWAKAKH